MLLLVSQLPTLLWHTPQLSLSTMFQSPTLLPRERLKLRLIPLLFTPVDWSTQLPTPLLTMLLLQLLTPLPMLLLQLPTPLHMLLPQLPTPLLTMLPRLLSQLPTPSQLPLLMLQTLLTTELLLLPRDLSTPPTLESA